MKTAAIILAGGRGSRLGGVKKAELEIGGQTLLDTVLAAVADCDPRIVVGYQDLFTPPDVVLTRENPPGSGPAAAVAHGLNLVGEDSAWVLTLACDLPGVGKAVPALVEAAAQVSDDVETIYATSGEKLEWLISIHRVGVLRHHIATHHQGVVNCSMRRLFHGLRYEQLTIPPVATHDIDTWEDHNTWQQRHREAGQI